MIDTTKYKLSGNGIKVTTVRHLNYKNGTQVPVGTELVIFFNETRPSRVVFEYNGKTLATRVDRLFETFKGSGVKFSKPPGIKSLERMSNDGIVSTVTGRKVEPDGYGDDGSPSWMLVMGII
jgi:hypothetical protein